MAIQRPIKTYGTRTYAGEVAAAPGNLDPIVATEVDGDLDTIYTAFNNLVLTTTIAATPPATPLQGQLWWRNDPDGNLYISYNDGNSTQWVPAVPSSSQLWTVSGATLKPVDATKIVTVPGVNAGAIQWGTLTAKGRLLHYPTVQVSYWSENAYLQPDGGGWLSDDATRPSWMAVLNAASGAPNDNFAVSRAAAGTPGTLVNLLTLDASGNLSTASAGTGSPKINLGLRCAWESWDGGIMTLYGNDALTLGYNAAAASWKFIMDYRTAGSVAFQYRPPSGNYATTFTFDAGGNLFINGPNATKSTGTSWINPSDRRIKKNVTDYTPGLDAICALRPIRFEHNGAAGTTDGAPGISFIADEVESVMPEMVGTQRAKLQPDDDEDTELKTLDVSPMLFAFVNAFKEVAARLDALEGK